MGMPSTHIHAEGTMYAGSRPPSRPRMCSRIGSVRCRFSANRITRSPVFLLSGPAQDVGAVGGLQSESTVMRRFAKGPLLGSRTKAC